MNGQNRSGVKGVWFKINSYGILIVGLLLLSILGVLRPENSTSARVLGYVPGSFYFYTPSFFLGGVLILAGFIKTRAKVEIAGLVVTMVALTVQDIVLSAPDPGGYDSWTRYAVWLLFASVTWSRISVLRSKDGVVVTIPGRGSTGGEST